MAGSFDSVRHDLLLAKVARRVNDRDILHLLKLMLKASGKRGVPQGGVISPLLSNIYLTEVDAMLERAKWTCPGLVDGERLRFAALTHGRPRPVEGVGRPVWGDREIAPPWSEGPCRGNTAVALPVGAGRIGFGGVWSRS